MKMEGELNREFTQALTYYINFLKTRIWNCSDKKKKDILRNRLFTANKLYYLFECSIKPKFGKTERDHVTV